MILSLAFSLIGCGGDTPPVATPPHAEEHTAPKPAPVAPKPEPAPAPEVAPPPEVEIPTLGDNELACMGNADCVVVQLGCCDGQAEVAANKGSADSVKKKSGQKKDVCETVKCEAGPVKKAKCANFKCAFE